MIRHSFRATSKSSGKAPGTFTAIIALAVLTLPLSKGHAATPEVSPASVTQDDGVIAQQVYDALDADPTYFFRHVEVQARHGVVTLSGYVWSTPSIYRAEKIASGVPGVTHVIDQMELERDGVAPHA